MRFVAYLGLLVGAVATLTGCHGMVKTYDERLNTYAQVLDADMRQIADDWDTIWLADRQSRLTEWHTR